MSDRRRILVVVPVFQSVYPAPFENFLRLMLNAAHREGAAYEFVPHVPARGLLHTVMNETAKLVIEHRFDALIVCDDDCLPPHDAIARLLRHFEAGRPIVAGLGFMRNYPHTTTIGRYYPEGLTLVVEGEQLVARGFEWVEDVASEADDLVPADFCGFPIALISRAALEAIAPPWFAYEIEGGACTHDVYFGWKAAKAKQAIVVDRTIECGHLMDANIVTAENRAFARGVMGQWQQALRQAQGVPG